IIEIGDSVARFEGLISSNFLLAGIVKISVCILAAAKGLSSLFHLNDHQTMVLPCGMLAMALCTILYKNLMDMFGFLDYYCYYAFPFQVLIPLAILIAGEIQIRKQKNKELPLPAADSP
ncbi:MAG: GerAB/ArcD/ProY family transporter, partial [Bacillota bacterium]